VRIQGRVVWTAPAGDRIRHGVEFREPKDVAFVMKLFLTEER